MEDGGRRESIPHVSALDGARGLAVAGVLFFHGGHLKGGYLGVDFFFTLSGFLITSLLLAEASRSGSIGLGGFWSRRARRLLPALAVLMIGVSLYSVTLAKATELGQIRGDAFATLGYVANWRQIFAHQSYFALFSAPSPLNHTWSLAIEEQFYVVWPLLFVALLVRFKDATAKAVLVTVLALAAVSSVLMITLYDPANSNRVYFGTDTRAAAILFGAALAAWLAMHPPTRVGRRRTTLEGAGIAGAGVLAVAWVSLDGQSSTLYRGGFLVCGLAATAIIAAAVHPEPGPVARILSFRPLCALGLISYGVYLYHWPIDVALDQDRAHVHGWPLFAVQTSVTLVLAIASYKLLEQPIRHGALSGVRLRKLTPAIALGLVIALFATTAGAKSAETSALAGGPQIPVGTRLAKFGAQRALNAAAPGSERIMIVGNSVGYLLGPAFQHIHTDPAIAVLDDAIPSCFFPPQLDPTPRAALRAVRCDREWETDAIDIFRPHVVFWIESDITYGYLRFQGQPVRPCTEPFNSVYEQSLRDEVAKLGARGAKAVITTEAYNRSKVFPSPDRYLDCNNRLRRNVAAATGAQLVDLFGYICPGGRCRETQNGIVLRADGVHYQGAGGEIVAKWLLAQVR